MKLQEIRKRIRSMLNDITKRDSLRYWPDEDLNDYINASIEEMCERTKCVVESLNDSIALITLEANKRHYSLHNAVIDIVAAQPSWRDAPLSKQTVATVAPGWLNSSGLPGAYLMDYQHRTLSLTSAPLSVSGESIRLTTAILPITELTADDDEPIVQRQYHRRLYDGAIYRAFLKQDSEVFNPEKSNIHKKLWEDSLDTIIRREARLRPRILVARSVEMS